MINKLAHFWGNIWERILLRGLFIAAILALIAGIFLERIHTPVWIYVLIFVVLLILVIWSDKWFVWVYRKWSGKPSILIDNIDYSQLIQNRSVRVDVKFTNKRGNKQVRYVDIIAEYTSILDETREIARASLKISKVVGGSKAITIPIPLTIVSPDFVNIAEGASRQELQLPLIFSLELMVRPTICRVPIPENISYSETLNYDKSPDYIP